jgi:cupin 2 domain-containing protein
MKLNSNLFKLPVMSKSEEFSEILENTANIKIERIISLGHTTNWLNQSETEFVSLLAGSAIIEFELGKTINVKKGDTITIGAHERHRVVFTSKKPACVWLCVFYKNT